MAHLVSEERSEAAIEDRRSRKFGDSGIGVHPMGMNLLMRIEASSIPTCGLLTIIWVVDGV